MTALINLGEQKQMHDHVKDLCVDSLTLVERLHRRLLDVAKDEFDRRCRNDINPVQALLLYNIGDNEVSAGELRSRGYILVQTFLTVSISS